jgi:hypothetical protein
MPLALMMTRICIFARATTILSASDQYEYNSNVFDLEPSFTFFGLGRRPSLSDEDYTYSGANGLKDQHDYAKRLRYQCISNVIADCVFIVTAVPIEV